eukprot:sb/3462759/
MAPNDSKLSKVKEPTRFKSRRNLWKRQTLVLLSQGIKEQARKVLNQNRWANLEKTGGDILSGIILIYPLHQKSKQDVLNRVWVWSWREQPLNLIRHYFGDEIAIYFAWLGFYTFMLVVPLLVGFTIELMYDDGKVESADWCFTFYAFFNVMWPTIFLELWKRRSAELAWQWGTLGREVERQEVERPQFKGVLGTHPVTGQAELQYPAYKRQIKQAVSLLISLACLLVVLVSMFAVFRRSAELAWQWGTLGREVERQEVERPQFKGVLGTHPVTGQAELQYPAYKRQIKQAVSLLISLACLLVVLVSMFAVFRFDDYIQQMTKEGDFPDFVPDFLRQFIKYTPKILLPVTVGILDVLYSNIATALNDWENYQHQRTYENWLVIKLILFKFVNSFLALFYIAFYLQDFEKLQEMLAALLITKQIVGNLGEILGPSITSLVKQMEDVSFFLCLCCSGQLLSQVETESEKPEYESSFDDYLEMFIQMGYVILFSAAYPLAAVWAFLNNIIEIRGDAFKMVNGVQRPFMKRVEDIGFWSDAFEVLSVISIIVNCSLIGIRGQVGRWFPDATVGQQILVVIFMEHVFLSIKYIIARAIPDIPAWVELERAKELYKREQALKGFADLMRTTKLKGQMQKKVEGLRHRLDQKEAEAELQPVVSTGSKPSRYKIE